MLVIFPTVVRPQLVADVPVGSTLHSSVDRRGSFTRLNRLPLVNSLFAPIERVKRYER